MIDVHFATEFMETDTIDTSGLLYDTDSTPGFNETAHRHSQTCHIFSDVMFRRHQTIIQAMGNEMEMVCRLIDSDPESGARRCGSSLSAM